MPSAKEPPNYLIVLTLREGRNFPFNAHDEIIAEAKFGTSSLKTDPKKYEVAPRFDEELCWSTTPRALHDHKLRRTPIKITLYGRDAQTGSQQQIGHITLDIRTYLTRDRPEWHSLVGVPYMREKPEIYLAMKCEDDDNSSKQQQNQMPIDAAALNNNNKSPGSTVQQPQKTPINNVQPKRGSNNKTQLVRSNSTIAEKKSRATAVNHHHEKNAGLPVAVPQQQERPKTPILLQPVMLDNESYFQLGSVKPTNEHFVFGLVLCYTKNLHALARAFSSSSSAMMMVDDDQTSTTSRRSNSFNAETQRGRDKKAAAYSFNFTLFGHVISNACSRLDDSAVRADRASLRVCTDLPTLLDYFTQQHFYQVTVSRGNNAPPSACADFDVTTTLVKAVRENGLPAIVYAEAPLRPIKEDAGRIPPLEGGGERVVPMLGISFQLARFTGGSVSDSLPKSVSSTAPPSVVSVSGKSSASTSHAQSRNRPTTTNNNDNNNIRSHQTNNATTPSSSTPPIYDLSNNRQNSPVKNFAVAPTSRSEEQQRYVMHNNHPKTTASDAGGHHHTTSASSAADDQEASRTTSVEPRADDDHAASGGRFLPQNNNINGTTTGFVHSQGLPLTSRQPPAAYHQPPVPSTAGNVAEQQHAAIDAADYSRSSNRAHHFCCTISLFSIRLTSFAVRKNIFVYARYTYAFFGTSAPIITRPSVEVPPRGERRFNNGYCSFSFACTSAQLRHAFEW